MLSVLEPLVLDSEEGRQRVAKLYRYAQIGHCVNSVTHDVNNFLGAIMAYAELIGMDSPLNPESVRMIEEIMGAVRRSSTLVNSLTSIARKDKPNTNLFEPGTLVEQVLDLRRYDFRACQVTLESNHEPNLPMLMGDRPKLEQALIYLFSNAMEEVRDTTHRLVKVRTRAAQGGVDIEVWNAGDPVPSELRDIIFQPFFTTKDEDHLGLGLSVARDIARLHGGDVTYDAKRGFVMHLPSKGAPAKA
jgi:signal transduction histidine kinase